MRPPFSNSPGSNRPQNNSQDIFGNPFTVVGTRDKKGNGFSRGFVELGGQLYKIEPTQANKEGVHYWVKITKMTKKQQSQSRM